MQKGFPEDLSVREFNEIRSWLLGRHVPHAAADTSVSIRFNRHQSRVAALAAAFPGDFAASEVTAYRYATITSETEGTEEPFIVALREKADGRWPGGRVYPLIMKQAPTNRTGKWVSDRHPPATPRSTQSGRHPVHVGPPRRPIVGARQIVRSLGLSGAGLLDHDATKQILSVETSNALELLL